MRIAFLACPETLTRSPTRRPDAFEHDLYLDAVRQGIGSRGDVTELDWRAPMSEFAGIDVALLGTPWNYTEAKDAFLARLAELEAAGIRVCNPLAVVRWNADKLYLRELEQRGAPSIPTLWPETPTVADVMAAFEHFGCERVVVKRRVGAGAIGQEMFTRAAPPPSGWTMDRPAMIQPFLPAIADEGELSFIFIDGALSHALVKQAAKGDYRIQSMYGGRETRLEPSPTDRASAQLVMGLLPFPQPPVYARIDMVRLGDGRLAVIEAELIEPYLYPEQGPELPRLMGEALLRLE